MHLFQAKIFILYRITFNLVKMNGWWPRFSFWVQKNLGVGVGSLLLSKGGHNVHEAPVVLDATLGTASLLFLLLLFVNLPDGNRKHCFFHVGVCFILTILT